MKLLNDLPEAHLLTAAQERSLAKRNKTKLVLHTMREAFVYAKQCCRGGLPDDDIYSLSYAALVSAARRYKPAKGRFFAYAKVFVRGQISREWRNLDTVKNSSMNSDPAPSPIQHVLLHTHEENETDIPLISENSVEPEFGMIDLRERLALIEPIIREKLTKREQQIIELRYKSGFNFTKIGDLFGLSRQWMEKEHRGAIQKIHNELARRFKI